MNIRLKKEMNVFCFFRSIAQLIVLLLLSTSAYSAEQPVAPVSYSSNLLQMMLGLGATIVMIFVVVWLIKRVGYSGYSANNTMKIKSSLPLSPKEKLLLVEVEGEKILIGVAPGFVGHVKTLEKTSISEASNPANEEKAQLSASNGFSNNKVVNDFSSSFAEKLKSVLNKPETQKSELTKKEEMAS